MALRWIPFSRVSMQRAGVLIAVTSAAHDTRPTSLDGITRAYTPTIRRRVPVPAAARGDVARYLRELRLWERYSAIRRVESLPPDAEVEIQDLWLANPVLPSATGAVTDEVVDELPQLAANLKLIRAKNFTRTDRGRGLLALLPDDQLRAFTPAPGADSGAQNPFVLSLGVRGYLAYTLLDADFEFMQAAYDSISRKESFTRAEFADRLNAACRTLRQRWIRRARSGAERHLLAELDKAAKLIDRPRLSGEKWGGGRPPDQLATLRLEPYVDFGLLTRLSRSAYRYELSDRQQVFFDQLVAFENADDYLSGHIFGSFLSAVGHQPQQVTDEEIWTRVRGAYALLKSALGFASFVEVALLAIGQLINEADGQRYFEVGDGLRVIRDRQRAEPRRVRFGVRRGGGLTYMKVVEGASDE